MRVHCSIAYLPTWPAYAAVPHAITMMREMPRNSSSRPSSSGMTTSPSRTRPRSVLATASGSSEISLAMNDDQPPLSAAAASQVTSNGSTSTALPEKSVTSTPRRRDRDDLVLPDRERVAGVLDERRDVGAEEVLALAEPDHERRVAARADDEPGLVLVHREERERALEARDDGAEGRDEIAGAVVLAAEQDGGDLGVGLAAEGEAVGEQLVLELAEVLDDAVVDDGELVVVGEVRVRVAVGRDRRGSPSGCGRCRWCRRRAAGRRGRRAAPAACPRACACRGRPSPSITAMPAES